MSKEISYLLSSLELVEVFSEIFEISNKENCKEFCSLGIPANFFYILLKNIKGSQLNFSFCTLNVSCWPCNRWQMQSNSSSPEKKRHKVKTPETKCSACTREKICRFIFSNICSALYFTSRWQIFQTSSMTSLDFRYRYYHVTAKVHVTVTVASK